MSVGVAGCGRMGLPMARALRRASINTTGFDIRFGGDFLDLPMEFDPLIFARKIDTLISMVRDEEQTEALLFSAQGIIAQAPKLEMLVICSTLDPAYMRELPSRLPLTLQVIDAPVLGDPIVAEEARLTFLMGGKPNEPETVDLLLAAMGETFYNMGPIGAGMTACLLTNLVKASSIATVRTALEAAQQHDLDPNLLIDCMNASSAQTWFSSNFDELDFARAASGPDNALGSLAREVAVASDLLELDDGNRMGQAIATKLRTLDVLNAPMRTRRSS